MAEQPGGPVQVIGAAPSETSTHAAPIPHHQRLWRSFSRVWAPSRVWVAPLHSDQVAALGSLAPEHQETLDADPTLKVADPELLRAAPANLLLRTPWLWRDNKGGEDTFECSKPVTEIDSFLSHSWQTPGWLKMVGVMYHMNAVRAVVVMFLIHISLHVFELVGFYKFPIPCTNDDPMIFFGKGTVRSFRPQFHCALPLVACFLVLWLGQEPPVGRIMCFLDKCCIHQTNNAKKMVGIRQLGAFLRRSKSMQVLWQPEYFTRLWCVYELAAFVHINKGDCRQVVFSPLKLPVFAIALCAFHSVASVAFTFVGPVTALSTLHATWVAETVPEAAQYPYMVLAFTVVYFFSMYGPLSPFLWIFCKWHMKDRREMLQQVHSFTFASAQCLEESDRDYVRGRIEEWFGGVPQFEEYVQTTLAQHVDELLQQQGPIPYRIVAFGSLSHFLIATTWFINAVVDEAPGLFNLSVAFIGMCTSDAIAIGCIMRLADTSFGDHATGETFLQRQVVGPLATTLIFSLSIAIPGGLVTPAAPAWLAGLIFIIGVMLTCVLYLPCDFLQLISASSLRGRSSNEKDLGHQGHPRSSATRTARNSMNCWTLNLQTGANSRSSAARTSKFQDPDCDSRTDFIIDEEEFRASVPSFPVPPFSCSSSPVPPLARDLRMLGISQEKSAVEGQDCICGTRCGW